MQNRRWNGSRHCSRRITEGSQPASEAWPLIESLDDPILTVGLSFALIYAKTETGESFDVLHWSERVIELADGDPSGGNFLVGSPLPGNPSWRAGCRRFVGA